MGIYYSKFNHRVLIDSKNPTRESPNCYHILKNKVTNSMMRLLANLTELKNGQSGIIFNFEAHPCRARLRRRRRRRWGSWYKRGSTDPDSLPFKTSGNEKELGKNAENESQCVQRLMDLGLTPGTKIVVVKSAPFRGPLEVLVRGSRIVIGREIASRITIEVM